MAGLVPANGAPQGPAPGQGSILEPLTSGTGNVGERARAFAAQPLVRKVLPWFVGMAGLGIAALLWATLAGTHFRTHWAAPGMDQHHGAGTRTRIRTIP